MTVPTTTTASADEAWFSIDGIERLPPFLVTLVSDDDHWLFAASNGGLTAGRRTPDLALFPYYTQDKLIDLAGSTGPLTRILVDRGGLRQQLWMPFDPTSRARPRRMAKRLDGTRLRFQEDAADLGLRFSYTWGFSRRFGFVRRCSLRNVGAGAVTLALLDGLQNLQACGLSADFQNQLSVLVDAYKRVECDPDTQLRMVYLSSIPTDRAEPSESLRCNVAWTAGLDSDVHLVTTRQVAAFEDGRLPTDEAEARGQRAACLDVAHMTLAPGQARYWYTVADVGLSTARTTVLRRYLSEHDDPARCAMLAEELAETSDRLQRKVATADGLQATQDRRRQSRHFSNTLFNIMRGGVFVDDDHVPRDAFRDYLEHFDAPVAQRHAAWVESLPERIERQELCTRADRRGDPSLQRLAREYLPLTFSRRHGDPSRPWNHFAIDLRDAQGRPRLSYQGNWRDIFQNWEALAHAFPSFAEGFVSRFLSASTADGYNPYRLTSEGFDWERVDPEEPWSNIGYWGDHQVIYLLRLLEAVHRFHPDLLVRMLDQQRFAYARVPYRVVPYTDLVAHPRDSIRYDHAAEAEIAGRVETLGADGMLLAGPDGQILHVNLFEKLLVALLTRMGSFVPGGGIWMNTQRPEWNDANNALAGFGLSVVTAASCHRYVGFLLDLLADMPDSRTFAVSAEVAGLVAAQCEALESIDMRPDLDPAGRRMAMDALGACVSAFREGLYDGGLRAEQVDVSVGRARAWLNAAQAALAATLRANRRPDGLFHSYNLLHFDTGGGGVEVEHLHEMLEGQAAILSAGLLSPREALDVCTALRGSALYRPDQDSYMLYPDRDLPRFLDKNRIDPHLVDVLPLLSALAGDPEQGIVETDADGRLRFAGGLRNGDVLRSALDALPERWQALVRQDGPRLVGHFEQIFAHHAFTGRSGTFFAYEGLGSIYWHMVSKLVLAIQEQALASAEADPDAQTTNGLAGAFDAALAGLGMHKSPAHHGAFPTDAYSHTPRHAGAQQPGMTGQVKEDLLVRLGELGVQVRQGRLSFRPRLLRADEFFDQPTTFRFVDLAGDWTLQPLPAGSLAFTFCQALVVYRIASDAGSRARAVVELDDGDRVALDDAELPADLSGALFRRTGRVRCIQVDLPASWLRDGAT